MKEGEYRKCRMGKNMMCGGTVGCPLVNRFELLFAFKPKLKRKKPPTFDKLAL